MILNHKTKGYKPHTNLQDTTTLKPQNQLVLPVQQTDTVTGSSIIITKPKPSFIPLPEVDSVRQAPKKKVYYNPLKTKEYLKYKDVSFVIDESGTLFTEQSYNEKEALQKLILKKTSKLKAEPTPKHEESITSKDDIIDKSIISKNASSQEKDYTTHWILGILIFITILFAWIRVFNNRYLKSLRTAVMNNQWAKKMYEEKNVISQRVSFIMNIMYLISLSLFIIYILKFFNYSIYDFSELQLFFTLLGILTGAYLGKYLFLRFVGWIVIAPQEFGEYLFNVFLYNKAYAFFLLPVLWIIPFVEQNVAIILVYSSIGVFVAVYLMRIFRGLFNCIRINVSIFYLILYLCALEIFPMLIIYKTITSMM